MNCWDAGDHAPEIFLDRSQQRGVESTEREAEHADARRTMVGTGDRSERIRTYNFPQSRITDHRIGLTTHAISAVMDGKFDELIEPLVTHFQAEALKRQTSQ